MDTCPMDLHATTLKDTTNGLLRSPILRSVALLVMRELLTIFTRRTSEVGNFPSPHQIQFAGVQAAQRMAPRSFQCFLKGSGGNFAARGLIDGMTPVLNK